MPIASYLLLPWFANNGGACIMGQNNGVTLGQIYLPAQITVSTIVMMAAQADSGKKFGVGLYDLDGNLVLDSGPINMSTSGTDELLTAAITPTLVAQGTYWLAMTTNSLTATAVGAQAHGFAERLIYSGTSVYGTAANNSSGGQLPATTGDITLGTPTGDDNLFPYVKLQA